MIIGVDEAGRGPVLGPLVMCACAADEQELAKLVEMGVRDSKLLTPQRREELAEEIKKLCVYEIAVVPPTEVDAAVNSTRDNLNLLEARTSTAMVAKLAKKIKIEKVILDCPSINVKKYSEYVMSQLQEETRLICEHKADLKYPIVAAASILAKVKRDEEMRRVSKLAGDDLGSGYMTDPKTYAWLQQNFDKGFGFIRRSWAPVKRLGNAKSQKSLTEFEQQKAARTKELGKFDKLTAFGFAYQEPKNQYEVVRMKGPEHVPVTIIQFTTGKLTVQGNDDAKKKANALLQSVGLL